METFKLLVKKTDATDNLDEEWAINLLDSPTVENGPRDLLEVEDSETMLTLKFKTENGLYYAIGRLDREGIRSYRLGKKESMREKNRRLFQRYFMKHHQIWNRETRHRVYVKSLDPYTEHTSMRYINEDELWDHMNLLNDVCSVCMFADGRYGFVSFATNASVWYTVGFFENDLFYDVQAKKTIS